MAEAGRDEASHHSRDEHQVAKELMVTLTATQPGEEDFEIALTSLITAIRHHVIEEETSMLPRYRESVGAEQMAELGRDFLAAKRAAPTYAHPAAPSSGLGHKLLDPAKVVDMVRDKASGRIKHLATDPSGTLDPQAQRLVDAFSALESAGVQVSALRFDGVMHEFFGAAAVLDAAERAQQSAAEHLRAGFARIPAPA